VQFKVAKPDGSRVGRSDLDLTVRMMLNGEVTGSQTVRVPDDGVVAVSLVTPSSDYGVSVDAQVSRVDSHMFSLKRAPI